MNRFRQRKDYTYKSRVSSPNPLLYNYNNFSKNLMTLDLYSYSLAIFPIIVDQIYAQFFYYLHIVPRFPYRSCDWRFGGFVNYRKHSSELNLMENERTFEPARYFWLFACEDNWNSGKGNSTRACELACAHVVIHDCIALLSKNWMSKHSWHEW